MQINIETFGADQTIDVVTVKAHGAQDGKTLLDKIMAPVPKAVPKPPIVGTEAPSKCTLRVAAQFFRVMAEEQGPGMGSTANRVAELLDLLADGTHKIQTIKAARELSGLGLREAKELVERVGPFVPPPTPYR
jgi:hypothetical protein